MLALDTPHADKLPPLDASIEETKDASYDTSDYQGKNYLKNIAEWNRFMSAIVKREVERQKERNLLIPNEKLDWKKS